MKFESEKYELLSVIVHHGPSVNSGHFTCVAKCPDNSFTEFDDAKVCFIAVQHSLIIVAGKKYSLCFIYR